jgi:hypothetical protein
MATTEVIINIHDTYMLALVQDALKAKGLALRLDTVTASSVFYGVQADAATLDEAAARTAAGSND